MAGPRKREAPTDTELHKLYRPLAERICAGLPQVAKFKTAARGASRAGAPHEPFSIIADGQILYRIRDLKERERFAEQITLRNVPGRRADEFTEMEVALQTSWPLMWYGFGPRRWRNPRVVSWYLVNLDVVRDWSERRVAVGRLPWHEWPAPQFHAIDLRRLDPEAIVAGSSDVRSADRMTLWAS